MYYLGVTDTSGQLAGVFSLGDDIASLGGWLNPNQIIGNATVHRDRLTNAPDGPFEVFLPAVFDLHSGRIHLITRPFLDAPFPRGRNRVQAVLHGPFARVTGTGSCLNVREEPAADARVLACAAENVLLKLAGDQRVAGGDAWERVITPGGVEGWASAAYLER
jgi:hypothetical protein